MEEDDRGYYSEATGEFIEAPRKQAFRVQVPYSLRFAIIWTLFFSIVGITIQSIKANAFIWKDFFTTSYIDWFLSFGAFTDPVLYPDVQSLVFAVLNQWYYFFYTGGLIALLWGLISFLVNFEVAFKGRQKQKPIAMQAEKQKPANELDDLLQHGMAVLAEGNVREAERIYAELKERYNPYEDKSQERFRRIKSFYEAIISQRK